MAWIADTFQQLRPTELDGLASVTGKPLALHGIPGRIEATARGVYIGIREPLDHPEEAQRAGLSRGLGDKRVVVQGLGNVGTHAARFPQQAGATVVAIAEREGAISRRDGLDVDAVAEHRAARGSLLGFPGAKDLRSTAEALELDCDILVPAALEDQITAENAPRIRARFVAEAANHPVDPAGEAILLERGIYVLPDLYLNTGGVTVSYFEWLKNLSHVSFDRMTRLNDEGRSQRLLGAMEH